MSEKGEKIEKNSKEFMSEKKKRKTLKSKSQPIHRQ